MNVLFKIHVSGENVTRIRVRLKGGPLWSSFTRFIDIKLEKLKIETIQWLPYCSIQSLLFSSKYIKQSSKAVEVVFHKIFLRYCYIVIDVLTLHHNQVSINTDKEHLIVKGS